MANATTEHSRKLRSKTSAEQKVRRKAEGYAYFSVELRPDAAAAIAAIQQQTGDSKNEIVNRALLNLAEK